jgi:hypothetical protein
MKKLAPVRQNMLNEATKNCLIACPGNTSAVKLGIAAHRPGVRFPHHHVYQAFTIKAGHGLGDDEPACVLAAGDLGLIAAFVAAEFIKPARGLIPPKKVYATSSGLGQGFLTPEIFPPHFGPWPAKAMGRPACLEAG